MTFSKILKSVPSMDIFFGSEMIEQTAEGEIARSRRHGISNVGNVLE